MRSTLLILTVLSASALMNAQNWTSWRPDPAFHGIEVRERCTGFNEFASAYIWDVQLRNTYHHDVDVAWAADPQVLHGAAAQADHALAVQPGEVVDAHHSVPEDCGRTLPVRVNDVRAAGSNSGPVHAAAAPQKFEGRWASKDPEPLKKQVDVQLNGNTVTGSFTSPSVSFQISTPLPEGLTKSVTVHDGK